jgi:hypothetical protein
MKAAQFPPSCSTHKGTQHEQNNRSFIRTEQTKAVKRSAQNHRNGSGDFHNIVAFI